ncbi:MAG: hypothetical protein ACHQX4_09375 [Gemmatimonadales bacterium]
MGAPSLAPAGKLIVARRFICAARAMPAALALAASTGCATTRQYLALRQVEFHVDRATDVRLAGILLDHVRSFDDLSIQDGARLGSALLSQRLPLVFELHIIGENPATNRETARLMRFEWTLLLNGTETVSGSLDTVYTFPPGGLTDVVLPIRLDVLRFFRVNGRDAFDLARGLAGAGGRPTEITVRATPTIETPIGAITYPGAITIVRRTVGGP